ncbi:hypothetical protein [uncultured Treponema sp.]|nr:hypothetical protein [uncultured Treponema sp.]
MTEKENSRQNIIEWLKEAEQKADELWKNCSLCFNLQTTRIQIKK